MDITSAEEYLRENASCDSGQPDGSQFLKFGMQLSYIVPFGLLYFSFMMEILKRKKHCDIFEDSFFAIHFVDGVLTLIFLLLDISFLRLTTYVRPVCEYFLPILRDSDYYLTPYFTIYLYLQLAKMLTTLTMSLNRYTAVNYPIIHKIMWTQHCFKAIILILVVPVIFVWPVAIAKTSFLPNQGQGIIMYEHKYPWARTSFGRILIGGSTLIVGLFSSIISVCKLAKLGNHMRRIEVSLTIATIFVSIGFAVMIIVQVVQLFVPLDTMIEHPWIATFLLVSTQFINDFYMLSGPIVLLILDKKNPKINNPLLPPSLEFC